MILAKKRISPPLLDFQSTKWTINGLMVDPVERELRENGTDKSEYFVCDKVVKISKDLVCNGEINCLDESDEQNCLNGSKITICLSTAFQVDL